MVVPTQLHSGRFMCLISLVLQSFACQRAFVADGATTEQRETWLERGGAFDSMFGTDVTFTFHTHGWIEGDEDSVLDDDSYRQTKLDFMHAAFEAVKRFRHIDASRPFGSCKGASCSTTSGRSGWRAQQKTIPSARRTRS